MPQYGNFTKQILHPVIRPFALGSHLTAATLNQSTMTKWHPEMERAG